MSMDYKNSGAPPGGGKSGRLMHPFSVGLIIGFALGLGLAFGFALYINRSAPPFKEIPAAHEELKPMAAPKSARAPDNAGAPSGSTGTDGVPKPKFDFYEILPGKQDSMPAKPTADALAKERIFLQAGAFQNSADADNLKARLALAGIEAQIQTAQLPDNKTWHRVRLGPYESTEEAVGVQSTLKEMEIQANMIRSRE
ncbi:MAG: SPOR domain-containing protein [Burkholderiales bacterium]